MSSCLRPRGSILGCPSLGGNRRPRPRPRQLREERRLFSSSTSRHRTSSWDCDRSSTAPSSSWQQLSSSWNWHSSR